MAASKKLKYKDSLKHRISKSELLSAKGIKQINIQFLMNAKKGVKNSEGEETFYLLHDKSYNQMKKYIIDLEEDGIHQILWNFPERSNLYHQLLQSH